MKNEICAKNNYTKDGGKRHIVDGEFGHFMNDGGEQPKDNGWNKKNEDSIFLLQVFATVNKSLRINRVNKTRNECDKDTS